MSKFIVKLHATVSNAIIEEIYEIEAVSLDEAENMVLSGDGELLSEEILDGGQTINEDVVEIKSK